MGYTTGALILATAATTSMLLSATANAAIHYPCQWNNTTGDSNWDTDDNWSGSGKKPPKGSVNYETPTADKVKPMQLKFFEDLNGTYRVNNVKSIPDHMYQVWFMDKINGNYLINSDINVYDPEGTLPTEDNPEPNFNPLRDFKQGNDKETIMANNLLLTQTEQGATWGFMTGSAVGIKNNWSQFPEIYNETKHHQYLNVNLQPNDVLTINAEGAGITIGGKIDLAGKWRDSPANPSQVYYGAGLDLQATEGDIYLMGKILNEGSGGITINGPYSVYIHCDNFFGSHKENTTDVLLQSGHLIFGSKNALGDADLVIEGGTIQMANEDHLVPTNVILKYDFILEQDHSVEFTRKFTVDTDAVFKIEYGNYVAFTGELLGSGSVRKIGYGDMIINNDMKDYEGDITVEGGSLTIGTAGQFKGNATVTDKARLYNANIIGGNVNMIQGEFSPGVEFDDETTLEVNESLGTARVLGNFDLHDKSQIFFDIDKDAADQLIVDGNATLHDGAKAYIHILDPSVIISEENLVLIKTTNGDITDNLKDIDIEFVVEQGIAKEYEITRWVEDRQNHMEVGSNNELQYTVSLKPFNEFITDPDTNNIATIIEQKVRHGSNVSDDWKVVLNSIMTLGSGEFDHAFYELVPYEVSAMKSMAMNTVIASSDNINTRLNDVRFDMNLWSSQTQNFMVKVFNTADYEKMYQMGLQVNDYFNDQYEYADDEYTLDENKKKFGMFVNAYGNFGSVEEKDQYESYDFKTFGATAGFDYRFSSELVAGVYFDSAYSKTETDEDQGKSNITTLGLGVYGTYYKNDYYLNGQVGVAYSMYENSRHINFNEGANQIERTAKSEPTGVQFTAAATVGRDFKIADWNIGPFASLQYAALHVDKYNEEGADSLNLEVDETTYMSLLGRIGARAALNVDWQTSAFIPEVRIAYQHQFFDNAESVTARFSSLAGSEFEFDTRELENSAIVVGAGMNSINRVSGTVFYVNYDAEFGSSEYVAHSVNGGMRLGF